MSSKSNCVCASMVKASAALVAEAEEAEDGLSKSSKSSVCVSVLNCSNLGSPNRGRPPDVLDGRMDSSGISGGGGAGSISPPLGLVCVLADQRGCLSSTFSSFFVSAEVLEDSSLKAIAAVMVSDGMGAIRDPVSKGSLGAIFKYLLHLPEKSSKGRRLGREMAFP